MIAGVIDASANVNKSRPQSPLQVLAIVQRRVEDSGEEYRAKYQCEQWEVPVQRLCIWIRNNWDSF
jgi:hypothetical protein